MIPQSKIDFIINQIIKKCPDCQGQGCNTCSLKKERVNIYARSNIPIDYWDRSWKQFEGDPGFREKIREILLSLEAIYSEGQSYAFVGNVGVGKSYAAASILKMAIVQGFSAFYITMSELINTNLSSETDSNTFLSSLLEVDFLILDEMDLRWIHPSEKSAQIFSSTLEYLLRSRFQNKLPTVICSNTIDLNDIFSENFVKAFDSLREQYIKVIYVAGKDYRKHGRTSR